MATPVAIGELERNAVGRHTEWSEFAGVQVVTNSSREPSADELAGVEWWQSLSEPRRADWLKLADSTKPADAWAEFKRRAAEGRPESASAMR